MTNHEIYDLIKDLPRDCWPQCLCVVVDEVEESDKLPNARFMYGKYSQQQSLDNWTTEALFEKSIREWILRQGWDFRIERFRYHPGKVCFHTIKDRHVFLSDIDVDPKDLLQHLVRSVKHIVETEKLVAEEPIKDVYRLEHIQGWACPRCESVISPFVSYCCFCRDSRPTLSSGTIPKRVRGC